MKLRLELVLYSYFSYNQWIIYSFYKAFGFLGKMFIVTPFNG